MAQILGNEFSRKSIFMDDKLACTVPFLFFLREFKTEMVLVPSPITFPYFSKQWGLSAIFWMGWVPKKDLLIVHINKLGKTNHSPWRKLRASKTNVLIGGQLAGKMEHVLLGIFVRKRSIRQKLPGPSSLGAKWFRYRVSIQHPLGFNCHPVEGAGGVSFVFGEGKPNDTVDIQSFLDLTTQLPNSSLTNQPTKHEKQTQFEIFEDVFPHWK